MNRRETDRRVEIAARLLEALYPEGDHPGGRAAVLDRIAAARAGGDQTQRPQEVAERALEGAYGTGATDGQRSAVLDAIAQARRTHGAGRGFPGAGPSRDTLLALVSTLAAAVIVGAVILGVRVEGAQTPTSGPAGLTAEELRLISTGAHRPEGPRVVLAPVVARPGTTGAAAAPTVTVHPAIAAMQRGCDQGSAVSCRRLGTLYQRGRGVGVNHARAFELYDRACRAGDARACTLRDAADHTLNEVDRDDRADAEYFSTLGL